MLARGWFWYRVWATIRVRVRDSVWGWVLDLGIIRFGGSKDPGQVCAMSQSTRKCSKKSPKAIHNSIGIGHSEQGN